MAAPTCDRALVLMVQEYYYFPIPGLENKKKILPLGHACNIPSLVGLSREEIEKESFVHDQALKLRRQWEIYSKYTPVPSLLPFTVFNEKNFRANWHCEACHSAFSRIERAAKKAGKIIPYGSIAYFLKGPGSAPPPKPDRAKRDALHARLMMRMPAGSGGTPPSDKV